MTDDLATTIVGGLLGGGVAGAVFKLLEQGRLFQREDRYRFSEHKRERYAAFLGAYAEWAKAYKRLWEAPLLGKAKERRRGHPQICLDALEALAWEVSLLTRRDDLHLAGHEMVAHLRALEAWANGESDDDGTTLVLESENKRLAFFRLAKHDLGVWPP